MSEDDNVRDADKGLKEDAGQIVNLFKAIDFLDSSADAETFRNAVEHYSE